MLKRSMTRYNVILRKSNRPGYQTYPDSVIEKNFIIWKCSGISPSQSGKLVSVGYSQSVSQLVLVHVLYTKAYCSPISW